MRITAQIKTETRRRILDVASGLFQSQGWQETTTRNIAVEAEIATGTLFNYFPTKEAIAAELIAASLRNAGHVPDESLDAELFSFIWSGFSKLREFRKSLGPALETIFSPLARSSPSSPGDAIRVDHLERVDKIIRSHGFPGGRSVVSVQLYWTLYLGVFAFYAADESPGQEDTLALLDQSLKLFVASLGMAQEERKSYERQ